MSVKIIARSIWSNPGNSGQRVKRACLAFCWQLQKHTLRSQLTINLPNGVKFRAHPDCVISSSLIYADWPEYNELMFVRSHLKMDDVIIDVGANVGHISLLLADKVNPALIFCFEPTPVSFKRLTDNWKINGWSTAGLHQAAVGAQNGRVFMPVVDHPVTTIGVKEEPSGEGMVQVPLVCLDRLRHLWVNQSVGLLKIDVEGYEREVFLGSHTVLEVDRPRLIMFESLLGGLDKEISSLLSDTKYVVFQLDSKGSPDLEGESNQNLFAVPEEYISHII